MVCISKTSYIWYKNSSSIRSSKHLLISTLHPKLNSYTKCEDLSSIRPHSTKWYLVHMCTKHTVRISERPLVNLSLSIFNIELLKNRSSFKISTLKIHDYMTEGLTKQFLKSMIIGPTILQEFYLELHDCRAENPSKIYL